MAEIDLKCRRFISISETMFGNFRTDKFILSNYPKGNFMAFKRSLRFKTRSFSRMMFPGVKILVSVSRKKFINIAWKMTSDIPIYAYEIREFFRNAEDLK